jgi:hypothetical protein
MFSIFFLCIPLIFCYLEVHLSLGLNYWTILRDREYIIVNQPVIYLIKNKRSDIELVCTCQVSATSLSLIPPDVLVTVFVIM